mmetsp:Transcript_22975/g.45886  ORF Transcript_22975/g.45886 Transcript_22975/m.45886 type:complete len:106 (-) Transcript_22975:235-552(-)
MEDAATAEISRAQIWQWQRHDVSTQDDRRPITKERIRRLVKQEVQQKCKEFPKGRWLLAGNLVSNMLTTEKFDDFLTTVCYPHILTTAYEGDVVPDDGGHLHSKL